MEYHANIFYRQENKKLAKYLKANPNHNYNKNDQKNRYIQSENYSRFKLKAKLIIKLKPNEQKK